MRQERTGAGTWVLVGAAVVTLLCLGLSAGLTLAPVAVSEPAEPGRFIPAAERRTPTERQVMAPPRAPTEQRQSPARKLMAQERPAERFSEMEAGSPDEISGLTLFPPPGTKPPLKGLSVPEGFELPPGYVRHYQVTDEGDRLPAILMFHPDYTPRDGQGRDIPIPPDRVVPLELAPPGLTNH